jgi:predicted Ser/Thr protein kinase
MTISKQLTRVNARFEGKYAEQIEYLTTTMGMGVSEVLRASVEYFYQAKRGAGKRTLTHIAPLIGKFGSGSSDLSANYKQHLSQLLNDKHAAKSGVPPRPVKSPAKRPAKSQTKRPGKPA